MLMQAPCQGQRIRPLDKTPAKRICKSHGQHVSPSCLGLRLEMPCLNLTLYVSGKGKALLESTCLPILPKAKKPQCLCKLQDRTHGIDTCTLPFLLLYRAREKSRVKMAIAEMRSCELLVTISPTKIGCIVRCWMQGKGFPNFYGAPFAVQTLCCPGGKWLLGRRKRLLWVERDGKASLCC